MIKHKLELLAKNCPEEINILNKEYWKEKIKDMYLYSHSYKSSKPKNVIPLCVFEFAPECIKLDYDINIMALIEGGISFYEISKELQNNKEFLSKYLNVVPKHHWFMGFPKELQEDLDIFKLAFAKDYSSYKWLPHKLKIDKDLVLSLVKQDGRVLEFLSQELKDNPEIAFAGFMQNNNTIIYLKKPVASKFLKNKDVATEFLKKYPHYMSFIHISLRSDIDFMLPYLNSNPYNIKSAGKKIKDNEDIMLSMAKYWLMHYATDRLNN